MWRFDHRRFAENLPIRPPRRLRGEARGAQPQEKERSERSQGGGALALALPREPCQFCVMIHFLEGKLVEGLPTQVVVDVQGVGYLLYIPLSSFDKLPMTGQQVKILTHLHVREDAMILYGFMTDEERDLFRLLINHVSGIGPKVALSVLSGMSVSSFKGAVVDGDIKSISQIKGLGKKTAERIVLELKDRVGVSAAWQSASAQHEPSPQERDINDAVLALIALGYKQVEAHKVVKSLYDEIPAESRNTPDIVKAALKKLA